MRIVRGLTPLIALLILAAFAAYLFKPAPTDPVPSGPVPSGPIVGADRSALIREHLTGKRIGLIVNQSSRAKNSQGGDDHLIDSLQKRGHDIKTLFAVEHGIRGTQDAGAIIDDGYDARSGLPIISLYGKNKAPSKQAVADLDLLVFDLQDVGVRFFTYLSSLHYIMESCEQNNVPLVVLDRPNPNIAHVDGPVLDPDYQSFVGMHPIPVLHGMTLGELARMINGQGWLAGGGRCELSVIPVKHYTRATPYTLPIKPSPNLPDAKSITLYPSLALFEATNISVGRGTEFPFQVLGGADVGYGAGYGDYSFTPRPVVGAALNPKLDGQKLYGKDYRDSSMSGLNIDVFLDWHKRAGELGQDFLTRPDWLDTLMGGDGFRKQVQAGRSEPEIRASWQADLKRFRARRAPYLLYFESGPENK